MKPIRNSPEVLKMHLQRCHIQDIFSSDVSGIAELFSFRKGEFLIEAEQTGEYILFLTSGKVRVYTYTISEKTHHLNFYQNIAPVFGEVNVLWGKPAASSVQALSDGTCIGISVVRFREKLLNDNLFLRYICETMAERLNNEGSVTNLDPVEVRFASFILSNQENSVFSFKLSVCADLLDTSYRHLFRVINRMCEEGILLKEDKGYRIIGEEQLKLISTGKQQLF